MKRFIALLLLTAFVAGIPVTADASYPHGYKLTHDDKGVAYVGYYFTWDAYRCKWTRYDYPKAGSYSHVNDNHSTTIYYQYTYNNASANAGASQGGLQGAFRYDQYDVGRDEVDSQHYVAAASRIDEGRLSNQHRRDVQAGYTQDRVLELRKLEAKERILQSLDSDGPPAPQVLQQFNSYSPSAPAHSNGSVASAPANLGAIEAKCARCHNASAAKGLGNDNVLSSFAEFTADQADTALDYITTLDTENNCAIKAQLSSAEHKELRRFLCTKTTK